MSESVTQFDSPYIIFLGDIADEIYGKTGLGLVKWRGEECVGQLRMPGCRVDAGVPDVDLHQVRAAGARTLIVGSAAVGGGIPPSWVATLCAAAAAGLDIVAGLHIRLASLDGLAEAAAASGARLIDVRVPPAALPVGTGRKRTGRRLLTVGTDCACGKKYTALQLDKELRQRNVPSDFRATGQGGILHPGYLQVTIGLLVGSQPDAFVVCHDPLRGTISGWPEFKLPSIAEVIDRTIAVGRLTNPGIRCVGVSLNTSKVPASERQGVLQHYAARTGLPCVDPLAGGVGEIADQLLREFAP